MVVASLKYFLTSGERARSSLTERKTCSDRIRVMTAAVSTVDSIGAEYLNWGAPAGRGKGGGGGAGTGLVYGGLEGITTSGMGRDSLAGWLSSGQSLLGLFLSSWFGLPGTCFAEVVFFFPSLMSLARA